MDQPEDTSGSRTLQTLERGLCLLDAVAAMEGRATAKALSRRLGVKLGTCYHLLRTLREGGYVVRLPGGMFDVGPRAASLGRSLRQRSAAAPEMVAILTRLHARTGETSYVCGWQHGVITLQEYISGLHALTVGNLDVGYTGHLYARASCRAVLAYLPESQVETMFAGVTLERLTPNTIVEYDELVQELVRTRRQGYAVDREGFVEGVSCVAAPFFGADQSPAGAFTVSAPTARFDRSVADLTGSVREAAAMATNLLQTGRVTIPREGTRTLGSGARHLSGVAS